jgi:hypothetical protein
MLGSHRIAGFLFSCVDPQMRIRPDHPLRMIRDTVNATLVMLALGFDGSSWASRTASSTGLSSMKGGDHPVRRDIGSPVCVVAASKTSVFAQLGKK